MHTVGASTPNFAPGPPQLLIGHCIYEYIFDLDISQKSAEIVVLVAFGVPLLKEITRHQLLAVINKYVHGAWR